MDIARRAALAVTVALGLAGCAEDTSPRATSTVRTTATTTAVAVDNTAARRFVDAVNSGSTDQVMATLTDDAVVTDSGRRFADAESIRDWVDTEVTGVGGRITVRDERPTAGGAELSVDFRSSGFNGTDLRYRFTTRGDLVADLTLGWDVSQIVLPI